MNWDTEELKIIDLLDKNGCNDLSIIKVMEIISHLSLTDTQKNRLILGIGYLSSPGRDYILKQIFNKKDGIFTIMFFENDNGYIHHPVAEVGFKINSLPDQQMAESMVNRLIRHTIKGKLDLPIKIIDFYLSQEIIRRS